VNKAITSKNLKLMKQRTGEDRKKRKKPGKDSFKK
jgi:hypothetical protein